MIHQPDSESACGRSSFLFDPIINKTQILRLLADSTVQYVSADDLKTFVPRLILAGALITDSKMALFIKNQGGIKISDLARYKHLTTIITQLGFDSVCSLLPLAEQTSDNYWILYAQGLYLEIQNGFSAKHTDAASLLTNHVYNLTSTYSRLDSIKRPQVLTLMRSQIAVIQNLLAQEYSFQTDAVFRTLPERLKSHAPVMENATRRTLHEP
jgi:hypothetical protein